VNKEIIKKIIYTIGSKIIRKKPFNFNRNEIKKILFIQLNFRGDLLFNTPLFEILNIYFKNAKTDVWIKSRTKDILINNPYINKVHIFDDIKTENYSKKTKLNIAGKIKFLNSIKKEKYDLILDFTGIYSTAIFSLFSKAKFSFGKNSQGFGFCYNSFDSINLFKVSGYLLVKYKNILKNALKIKDEEWKKINKQVGNRPKVYISEQIKSLIDSEFKERNINDTKKIVCIHLTAGWDEKRWNENKYKDLIKILIDKYNCEIIFTGDSNDEKIYNSIIENLGEAYKCRLKKNFFGNNFIESAEIIRRASIYIGSDSGPLHLASAVNTPTIAIFGPTNPLFCNPVSENNFYIYKQINCSASENDQYCTRNAGRNCRTIDCLKMIEVDDVLKIVENIILNMEKKY
jgi:ADP-heptose:LPS heptosyltransferase